MTNGNIDFTELFRLDDDMVTPTGRIGNGTVRTPALDEARIRNAEVRLNKTVLPEVSWEAGQALGLDDLDQAQTSTKHDAELSKSTSVLDSASGRREASGEGWGEDISSGHGGDRKSKSSQPNLIPAAVAKFARSDVSVTRETNERGRWQHVWKNGVGIASRCDSDDGATTFYNENGDECDESAVADCFAAY